MQQESILKLETKQFEDFPFQGKTFYTFVLTTQENVTFFQYPLKRNTKHYQFFFILRGDKSKSTVKTCFSYQRIQMC